jgi:phage antirepressor YoqD-like protein
MTQKTLFDMEVPILESSNSLNSKNHIMPVSITYICTYNIAQVAQILNLPFGKNILLRILREKDIVDYSNSPYFQYFELGYFKRIEKMRYNNSGYSDFVLLVTDPGLKFIQELLKTISYPNKKIRKVTV